MNSRALNKRVEIYSASSVSNGFGGNAVEETLIGSSWAKVTTLKPGFAQLSYGLQEGQRSVEITMRKRDDLTLTEGIHFIKYRSKKYTIAYGPVIEDFRDRFVKFIGTESNDKSNVAI